MHEQAGASIHVRGLRHEYRGQAGPLPVLVDVDLDIPAGGYAAVAGPSGAGKSTLLGLLGGLEPVQAGVVVVGGRSLDGLTGAGLAVFRRLTVGFVFQHFGLLEALSARENVEVALALAAVPPHERRLRALELLRAVGLEQRAGHRPAALSGGERQRVAIARALANRPALLLADEPTGSLDQPNALAVLDLLERLRREAGCTLLIATHQRDVFGRAEVPLHLAGGRLRVAA